MAQSQDREKSIFSLPALRRGLRLDGRPLPIVRRQPQAGERDLCRKQCRILADTALEFSDSVDKSSWQKDPVICHLERVHTSHHVEKTVKDNGESQSTFVNVAEQEYLLQNVSIASMLVNGSDQRVTCSRFRDEPDWVAEGTDCGPLSPPPVFRDSARETPSSVTKK
jgi:hypothetical protein